MAQPYKHPVDDLSVTAEDTARILWHRYQVQLKFSRTAPHLEDTVSETFQQWLECRDRIRRLIQARDRVSGPGKNDSK